jgi:hydroxypyruvate isomerase
MLYTEHPFLDRFAKAALAGFSAVEYSFPYEFDLAEVKARLEDLGQVQVLFNSHAGDPSAGEWGTLSNPQRRPYFQWSVAKALEVARFLNCARLHVMFGNQVAGIERNVQVECAIENLCWAAPLAAEAGVTLLIEPLNQTDFPSYVMHRTSEALSIISEVNQPHVKLQYDIYHAQMTEGNLINTITSCLASHRTYPNSRCSRPARARHRGNQLSHRVECAPETQLLRLCGPRIPTLQRFRFFFGMARHQGKRSKFPGRAMSCAQDYQFFWARCPCRALNQ